MITEQTPTADEGQLIAPEEVEKVDFEWNILSHMHL